MNHYFLIYDAKQGGTFELGRWRSSTSPDLCFVSKETLDHPLQARKTIGTAKIPKESTPFGSIYLWKDRSLQFFILILVANLVNHAFPFGPRFYSGSNPSALAALPFLIFFNVWSTSFSVSSVIGIELSSH